MIDANALTPAAISEVVELAWADDVSFDAIFSATGLSEAAVIGLMRAQMKPSSFRMWRRRVSGRRTKHARPGLGENTDMPASAEADGQA